MAQKTHYDADLTQRRADECAQQWIEELEEGHVPVPEEAEISCQFLGAAREDGFDVAAKITAKSHLGFRWCFRQGAIAAHETRTMRCDHFWEGGVKAPEYWKHALKAVRLPEVVTESADRFMAIFGFRDVTCRVLGSPHVASIYHDGRFAAGSILKFECGSCPVEYVLCANVRGPTWLCHRGSFQGHTLKTTIPFDVCDLVEKNLETDLWQENLVRPMKRMRGHFHAGGLASALERYRVSYNQLIACAQCKAEQIKARSANTPIDEASAFAFYEPSPWRWADGARQHVSFQWCWSGATCSQYEIVTARLDHVFERRVPFPVVMESDDALRKRLEEVTTVEMTLRRTPCIYLGMEISGGRYEADPGNWPSKCYPSAGKTKATVVYEWQHVRGRGGCVHRTAVDARHILHHDRGVPKSPLTSSAPSGLVFTIEFADALAKAVHESVEFKGLVYEGDRGQPVRTMPNGGIDCQNEPLYWTLPDGRCVCKSLQQMALLRDDELAPQDSHEAYLAVARELGYDALGKPEDDDTFEEFRLDPGTIAERKWAELNWLRPADETAPCWWVANAADAEGETPVKLVCRSLQVLRLELHATRLASSTKLRQEWERRVEGNARAVDVLESNSHLWRHVGGLAPERFRKPTQGELCAAAGAVASLRRLLRRRKEAGQPDDGLETYAEEIIGAVGRLRIVSWEAIQRERFSLTPLGMYNDLCRNAQILLERHTSDAARRQSRLAGFEPDEQPQDEGTQESEEMGEISRPQQPRKRKKDRYGLDLDVFKNISPRKPHHWARAVAQASEIHIDNVRSMLELHYDEIHTTSWLKRHAGSAAKVPARDGKFKVFQSVATLHRSRLNQQLVLPSEIKRILRKPSDEGCWDKLEELRVAVAAELEGSRDFILNSEDEIERLAQAIESCTSELPDQVGKGSTLPEGARVCFDLPASTSELPQNPSREEICAMIRVLPEGAVVRAKTRALRTSEAPSVDEFSKAILKGDSFQVVAREHSFSK